MPAKNAFSDGDGDGDGDGAEPGRSFSVSSVTGDGDDVTKDPADEAKDPAEESDLQPSSSTRHARLKEPSVQIEVEHCQCLIIARPV